VPDVACVPLHPPVAVQLVAFVDDHVREELAPLATDVGLAVKVTVGADVVPLELETVSTTEELILPPVPEHVRVYVPVAVTGPTVWDPDVALEPDQAPLAEQLVAPEELQVRTLDWFAWSVVGFAVRETEGGEAPGAALESLYMNTSLLTLFTRMYAFFD